MEALLAIATGILFAAGLYMVLRRSLVKILVGILLLGYAVNLLLFDSSRLIPAKPPLIPLESASQASEMADPVNQALILTAIVISFGVTAFAIVLMKQVYRQIGSDDLNEIHCTDIPCSLKEIPTDECVDGESP